MALDTAQLKTDLLAIYTSARADDGISDDTFADEMVSAISAFVQSGTVNTVVTAVTPGGGTANGTGTIS